MSVCVCVYCVCDYILFCSEQEAITHYLTDWQNAKPNRALITLGGDVHMGGFTDSWVSCLERTWVDLS